jgi:sulfur-oxidizing protein SoxZ
VSTASKARTIVRMPATARRGEVIEIRTLVGHVMETGFRRATAGGLVPRDIVRSLVCTYNGAEVFRAELHPAIAANPLVSFTVVAAESGSLEFRWSGDNGFAASASASLVVT